jgi:hypothetical protein
LSKADWSLLSGGLTPIQARTGPTAGTSPPNGGGTHVYGMRNVDNVAGCVGLYCLQTNFSPTPDERGGRISGALRRAGLGASTGFAPFLFFCAQGQAVASEAYILGLSDENASHIQLRKGPIAAGLPAVSLIAPTADPHVLMRSTNTFPAESWQHLRLDVIVQGTGDVILQVYRNDLDAHPVTAPVWVPVPGMEGSNVLFNGFVDDSLGVNTGSVPLTSGCMGFACRFETANRAAFLDQISCERQL